MKKLFLITALMLISIVNALAEKYTDANGVTWSFSVSETEATITGASGYGADLVIPEKVLIGETEYAVTSIGSSAFHGCSSLASVDLSNCTSIGYGAFYGCSSLTSVDLSNCTSIDSYAFYGCSSLASVDLSNCTSIGSRAFYGCSYLTSVGSLASCTSIDSYAFYGCSSLTSVGSLAKLTTIPDYAFYECSSLKLIEDFSKIVSIGDEAFAGNSYAVFTITNETPPTVGNGCFAQNTLIKVPENLVTTYQTADGWENYALQIISTTAHIIRKTIFLAIQKRNEQISEPKRKTNRYWKRQTHKPKSSIKKPRKNYIFRGFFALKICSIQKKFVPLQTVRLAYFTLKFQGDLSCSLVKRCIHFNLRNSTLETVCNAIQTAF